MDKLQRLKQDIQSLTSEELAAFRKWFDATVLKKQEELHSAIRAGIEEADSPKLIPAEEVFERLEKRAADMDAAAHKKRP